MDSIAELTELTELKELYRDRVRDLEFEFNRAQKAEAELEISQARTFAARTRAERAEAALAERDKPCVWRSVTATWWKSECGEKYVIAGRVSFCPGCGHPVTEVTE